MVKVGPNTHVVIKYSVRFQKDVELEEKPGMYAADLLIGHDRIIPAIEEAILGAKEGDTFEVLIPKEQALGAGHPVYADILVEKVRPATPEDIATHAAKSCGGG